MSAAPKDKELDELVSRLIPAALTRKQVYAIEENAGGVAVGQGRRLMLAVEARTLDELERISQEAPDVFEELTLRVDAFVEHAEGLLSLARQAQIRLQVGDARRPPMERRA